MEHRTAAMTRRVAAPRRPAAEEAREMNALSIPHRVTRLVFEAGQPYEKFLSRYEAAVPPADPRWLGGHAGRHVRWPALRTLIYIDSRDRTRFAVDQPSTVLSGFTDPAIARLGVDLDHQLAELLDSLGVDAGQIIGAAHRAGRRAEAV